MKEVIITKGLPGSGKTTWAREQMSKAPTNSIKRVNKDDLRAMIDSSVYSKGNEAIILEIRNSIITKALDKGKNVIVDDTNLHPKHEKEIRELVSSRRDVKVVIKDFRNVSFEKCIEQNAQRGVDQVPYGVIKEMYEKYIFGNFIYKKEIDVTLPFCIICDLDGTLALISDRNPYDASTCFDDEINAPVLSVVRRFSHLKVFFLSGRDSKYKEETIRFIEEKCKINFHYELIMRSQGDTRKDSIVKREFYKEHIEGKYNVHFILDDRNQVVDMWRQEGLNCFQVAPGNF